MTIERKQPYGPIDEAELKAFERQLPAPLPSDLRAFLVEFNGAAFSDAAELNDVPGGAALETVFGLHEGPDYFRLDEMFSRFKPLVPDTVLVFAADRYGNYFGISLAGTDVGAVYFVDHEYLPAGSFTHVANSFTELLHRSGADIKQQVGAASIPEAIDTGDADTLRHLVAGGADVHGSVHHAVRHGDLRILRAVLEAGGDPNERGAIGGTETPLFVAARQGRADLTELLLIHGADPNLRCGAGGTALEMAAPWPRVVEILLGSGAKPVRRQ